MPGSSHRIVYRTADGLLRRVSGVWYGSDGSYYVDMPSQAGERALFFVFAVNYATAEQRLAHQTAVDIAEAAREDKPMKYSHHPDGFIQFSGPGLKSGRHRDGRPKGIGIKTWALASPTLGPSFGLVVNRPEEYLVEAPDSTPLDNVEIVTSARPRLPAASQLVLSGYYFPALWRRFVTWHHGAPVLTLMHPCRAALELRVLPPPASCRMQGFLALEMWEETAQLDSRPGFIFSGSTGNLRRGEAGELLGDGIYCACPGETAMEGLRSLDYDSRMTLGDPPYVISPASRGRPVS